MVSNGLGVRVADPSDATPELRGSWRSRSLLALASVFLLLGPLGAEWFPPPDHRHSPGGLCVDVMLAGVHSSPRTKFLTQTSSLGCPPIEGETVNW
ncbi:hypothetical protein MRX96_039676 [Rhipicephalus microplus]